jgi:glycosyltransferase involved in cell wall biosynthesis
VSSSQPRKILFVNSWSTAHGGSSTSLLDVVTHLDPARYTPIVLCPTEGELPHRLRDARVPVVIRGLHRPNRQELYRFVLEVPAHWRWLRSHGIDLVHGNTSASRRSVVQAAVSAGVPYIQHVRNTVKHADSYGFGVAKRIVCNSDATAAVLRQDMSLRDKTVTVYNAVDLSRYDEERDTRRNELGIDDRRPVVGFVGQIVPRKGVTTLIRAMAAVVARVPTALLVIVGCAPPDETEYEAECHRLVRQLELNEHVRFVGYRRDVPAFMRTFDVFALPTRSEPFGKVVIEAMAASCPVVASRVGGIPEIINEQGLGTLVAADDPASLAAAVLTYLTDARRRGDVAARAAASVRARFGMATMLDRLQALYDDVLAGRSPFVLGSEMGRQRHQGVA